MQVTIDLIAKRIYPEDIPLFHEMISRARSTGSDMDYEYRLQMPDKSVKYMHLVARATRDRQGQLEYIGAVQDVTERWMAQEVLSKTQSELARVARLTTMGQLAASIAHEINQPLAGLVMSAEAGLRWLNRQQPELDEARAALSRIANDGKRAEDVIKRLRGLARKSGPELAKVRYRRRQQISADAGQRDTSAAERCSSNGTLGWPADSRRPRDPWLGGLLTRRHVNVATVAFANKSGPWP